MGFLSNVLVHTTAQAFAIITLLADQWQRGSNTFLKRMSRKGRILLGLLLFGLVTGVFSEWSARQESARSAEQLEQITSVRLRVLVLQGNS